MIETVITTHNLSKSFGSVQALDHVSIHVKKGAIYGLIGDNGAGKTTLLKLLAGHLFKTEGSFRLFGKESEQELAECRRKTGVLIESTGYFPQLSVEQTIEYYRLQKGVPGQEKTQEILQLVGLWEKRKSKGKNLSMGMKQRLGLAIAMIGEPQILLLDEPINGLDPSGMLEFRHLLKRLNQEKGLTILLSSHILSELQQTATFFGFLNQGKLMAEISLEGIQNACVAGIELKVSDLERYAALFDDAFPEEYYQILPNQVIRLTNPQHSIEEYSRLASDHAIYILKLEEHQLSLEEFYLKMKNGGEIDAKLPKK